MLILFSFCPVPVSHHLPRWQRTITSQLYFLNVLWGLRDSPLGPQQPGFEAVPPWSAMQSSNTRERLAALQGLADAGVNHGREDTGKNDPHNHSSNRELNIYQPPLWTVVMISPHHESRRSGPIQKVEIIIIINSCKINIHDIGSQLFLPKLDDALYLLAYLLPGLITS